MESICFSTVDNKFHADVEQQEHDGQFVVILSVDDEYASVSCGWARFATRDEAEAFASKADTPLEWAKALVHANEGMGVIEQKKTFGLQGPFSKQE